MNAINPALAVGAVIAILAIWVAAVFGTRLLRMRILSRARVIEIRTPPETTVHQAVAFWTQVLGLLRPRWYLRWLPPHIAWEYVADARGVRIQVWVPRVLSTVSVERAIEANWPGATTARRSPVLPAGEYTSGSWVALVRADHYPVRTQFAEDPLRGLFGELSDLAPGQLAVVRICARPAPFRRAAAARGAAAELRGGHASLLPDFAPGRSSRAMVLPGVSDDVRSILKKAESPRVACQVSCLMTTEHDGERDRQRLRGRTRAISAAFSAFTSGANGLRRRWMPAPKFWLNRRHLARGYLLSTNELANLAHLPTDAAVPGLARAGARSVTPSPDLPLEGRVLGVSDNGPSRPIAQGVAEGRQHTHVLGKTGSGKSTLLTHMICQDVRAGRSALVIEPRGDLILDVLDRLPKEAVGRTIVFDPLDAAPPPRINLLQIGDAEYAAETVTGILRKIYADSWGPRTDDIARSSALTLARAKDPGLTLGDIPRLLQDDGFRARVLAKTALDRGLGDFWTWYNRQSPQMQAAATDPLLNKLRTILLRPWAAAVLASGPSTIDVPNILNGGGAILMRLPKGRLGESTSSLVGTIALATAWNAITARSSTPEDQRPDTMLYLDEAANFLNLPGSVADMLAEARGYHAGMVLAHQNLDQLPPEMRAAAAANCRTKVFFNASADDAAKLQRHTLPYLNAFDLGHLGPFQAAVATINGAAELPAATMRTRPLPPPIRWRAQQIRRASRRFGPRTEPRRTDPRRDQEAA